MEKFNKVGNYNIPLDYAKNEFSKKISYSYGKAIKFIL